MGHISRRVLGDNLKGKITPFSFRLKRMNGNRFRQAKANMFMYIYMQD